MGRSTSHICCLVRVLRFVCRADSGGWAGILDMLVRRCAVVVDGSGGIWEEDGITSLLDIYRYLL